ncbi:MAG: glycosyltransferase, partial [Anaerolineae bacterium]
LVFTGKMDYRPNIDAAIWFTDTVLPLIRAAIPNVYVYFVGKNPSSAVYALGKQPGVTVTGYVPEIQPYLAAADCYIAPLRVGGGTRLKLLEAMACGLPIVSTNQGAEGLDVVSSTHLLLARSADAFAQAVVRVLSDHNMAAELGTNARELACTTYDWDVLLSRLAEAYKVLDSTH